MSNRNEIAAELLRNCPAECASDYAAIADALRRDEDAQKILAMQEVNDWPETYAWLKSELAA